MFIYLSLKNLAKKRKKIVLSIWIMRTLKIVVMRCLKALKESTVVCIQDCNSRLALVK